MELSEVLISSYTILICNKMNILLKLLKDTLLMLNDRAIQAMFERVVENLMKSIVILFEELWLFCGLRAISVFYVLACLEFKDIVHKITLPIDILLLKLFWFHHLNSFVLLSKLVVILIYQLIVRFKSISLLLILLILVVLTAIP